jgi:hypothetical protein
VRDECSFFLAISNLGDEILLRGVDEKEDGHGTK